MKFANIIFDRNERLTIGDDMQLLAIENLYNNMGIKYDEVIRIPFHDLGNYDGEYAVLPISFPLFGYNHDLAVTQFSPKIIPVFLALSTLSQNYSKEDLDYLRRFEPIGCRDLHTMEGLRKNNILAYLNGCMTATFPNKRIDECKKDREKIFCIDVPDSFRQYIPEDIIKNCIFLSHTFYPEELPDGPEAKAKELYEMYIREAKMIVTTRLHGALPCIAAGIPVIMFKKNLSFRFTGIDSLFHIYTEDEYDKINWDPVPVIYEEHKKKVIDTASKRIKDTYRKYEDIFDISSFYESREPKDYFVEFYDNSIAFIKNNFKKEENFEYALWGVTQTAEAVNGYIKKNYPNARLAGVIDKSKDINFLGVDTVRKEWIKDKKDVFCFVCTGAAIKEAYEYFDSIKHNKFYQCCEDGNRHEKEGAYKNMYRNVEY